VLTKFSHVESRLSGRQRPTEVVFYAPLNLCDRRACSASVAVGLKEQEKADISKLQIKMDNGPESNGKRTQFLYRMVQLADTIGKPIQLLYYPPYHSKYNPIERCWGILELHWNGTKLIDAETMLEWAKSMTWKGLYPVVELSRQVYQKGVRLSKKAMEAVEARLKRDAKLPKYDILIQPASTA
jgi:hypothetical protein